MLRWLILIPFAIGLAVMAGVMTLLVFTILVPEMGTALVGAVLTAMRALFDAAMNGEDMALAAGMAGRAGLMAGAILLAPVTLIALGSEWLRWRGWMAQAAGTGLLTITLPLALLAPQRLLSSAETRIAVALGLLGIITGTVYWLVAGRDAGGDPKKTGAISPGS